MDLLAFYTYILYLELVKLLLFCSYTEAVTKWLALTRPLRKMAEPQPPLLSSELRDLQHQITSKS